MHYLLDVLLLLIILKIRLQKLKDMQSLQVILLTRLENMLKLLIIQQVRLLHPKLMHLHMQVLLLVQQLKLQNMPMVLLILLQKLKNVKVESYSIKFQFYAVSQCGRIGADIRWINTKYFTWMRRSER